MKQAKSELPTRPKAVGVCFQGQDWGDMNVARVRFPASEHGDSSPISSISTAINRQ